MVYKSNEGIKLLVRAPSLATWGNPRRWPQGHRWLGALCSKVLPAGISNDLMYKRIPVKKLTGAEIFKNAKDKNFSVLEFWRYGFSNLNSNVLRGALAEFLVENALKDKQKISVRNPWGDSDVTLDDGTAIEVKCGSYIQDWDQNELSKIVFSGLKAKTLYWSSAVSKLPRKEADYKSDVYVLALLKHQDPRSLDILNLDQWCFYVLPNEDLKRMTRNGNSVSIGRLEKNNVEPVSFSDIPRKIDEIGKGRIKAEKQP